MKNKIHILITLIATWLIPNILFAQVSDEISILESEISIEQVDRYIRISAKDCGFLDEIGNPNLPVRIEKYVIPFDAIVTGIQVTSVNKQKLKGSYYIFPTQPQRPLDGSEPPAFVVPNETVYNSSNPYPGKSAEILSDEFLHGYHVVTVAIYPVEYIPKNMEIYLQTVSFTINYSSSKSKSSTATTSKQSIKRAVATQQFIKGYVKNKESVDNFSNKNVEIVKEKNTLNIMEDDTSKMKRRSTSVLETLVPDYIIITNEALKPTFKTLADWKTKKGVPTIIKTVEEIEPNYPGSDLPEKIRNYLKEAYSNWDAGLYVLLGGDVNVIPARFVSNITATGVDYYPTDLYYTTKDDTWNANNNNIYGESTDNVDYAQDFILGRASVENITEAQTFVNKVIAYEKYSNLGSSSYVNNFLCVLGFLDKNSCGVSYNDGKDAPYSNQLKDIASTYMPTNIAKWFLFDNYDCQYNSTNPYSTPFSYVHYQDPSCNEIALLNESFEAIIDPSDDLPPGWQKDNNFWARQTPPVTIGVHHIDKAMRFKSSTIGIGNSSSLISPSIVIPDNNQILKFAIYHDDLDSKDDKIIVDYELNGNGIWINLCEVYRYFDFDGYTNKWWEHSYSLPLGMIRIRIKGFSDGGSDMYIDNIVIAKEFGNRIGGECLTGNQTLNKSNTIANLNNGGTSGLGNFHIIYHLQHSGVKGMGISNVTNETLRNEDFDGLTNGKYQQILFTNGCKPATFTQDCIGEHYINNPNGGGVAFIGDSYYGYYGEHVQFQNFCDALYTTTGHPSLGFNLGFIFQKAPYSTGWYLDYQSQQKRLTLLGDSEMPVWTNTPQTLNVSVSPTAIVSGENTIVVSIQNLPTGESATICLQKGDEGYATQTVSANGSYNFTFTPHTSGQVNVTVTAHNFKPYEATIPVNTNQGKNMYISNLTFDDDKTGSSIGNSDQQIDASETIELSIDLKNNGVVSASNVSAVLTCNSPFITISNNQSGFGNIASGETKTSLTKYVFTVDKDAPEILVNDLINQVNFILQITEGTDTYTDVFNIGVNSPDIEQGNKIIISTSDGDLIIEPNETVTINIDLFNNGKAQATGITGQLFKSSSLITSCSSTLRNYPAIGKFETNTNSSVYQFTVSSSYTVGQALPFVLQVKNEFGKTWSFNFNLLDKPTKIVTSTIDFIADKTEIKLFWTPVANIKGYNVYRSNADANGNDVGNYVKLNTFTVTSAFLNDLGLSELTKYYYKVSAISLTGNESELSDAFLAWTSYPPKGLFPLQMDDKLGTSSSIIGSINIEDVNFDYKKEIFAVMSDYLLGFNHDGTEMFDIDLNETSYSGFAPLKAGSNSTPSIGDLNSDGNFNIINSTRVTTGANYVTSYSSKDNNSDGLPDLSWYETLQHPSYRGSIVSNLDNSTDGSLETIVYSEWGGIRVYSSFGQLLYSFAGGIGGTFGALAVADIDGDVNGDKELIGCYNNSTTGISGIYIWHHDGTNYGSSQPFYKLSGYIFIGSPVVCNIDRNGVKDILAIAMKNGTSEGRIIAIDKNGTGVSGWNGTQKLNYPSGSLTQEISVGDLNGDGNLEVVAIGENILKVWNKSGAQISSTTVNNLNPGKLTPILADVDDDSEIEIIFGSISVGLIHAYNMDGSKVLGFPLHVDTPLQGSPCVADVDNNGKNEIIAGSERKVYTWETNGNSQLIEWGCERHDCRNTGEYYKICSPTIISSNTTWSTNAHYCGDIVIKSGSLTIKSNISMSDGTKILIFPGASLIVDADYVSNVSIKALENSSVIIKNNGTIKIAKRGEFSLMKNVVFDYQYGTINLTE